MTLRLHTLDCFAEGGMGRVHLAFRYEEQFRRTLALKRLHRHLQGDAKARADLLREAQWSGLIRHPNVVSVIDVGEDADGVFLLMDYVDGVALSELLTALPAPVPPQLALSIAGAVALGLHAAHSLTSATGEPIGLMHRDVSPSNVLIGFDGSVRLSDFGLAHTSLDPRTHEMLRGTSGYMSPEQLRFERVDYRADLFALGVLLYELLDGRRLYGDDDTREAARRVLHEPLPELRAAALVSEQLASLLGSLLAKTPSSRPRSALDVHRVIEHARRHLVRREGPLDLRAFLLSQVPELVARKRRWLADRWERVEWDARPDADGSTRQVALPQPRPAVPEHALFADTTHTETTPRALLTEHPAPDTTPWVAPPAGAPPLGPPHEHAEPIGAEPTPRLRQRAWVGWLTAAGVGAAAAGAVAWNLVSAPAAVPPPAPSARAPTRLVVGEQTEVVAPSQTSSTEARGREPSVHVSEVGERAAVAPEPSEQEPQAVELEASEAEPAEAPLRTRPRRQRARRPRTVAAEPEPRSEWLSWDPPTSD